MFTVNNRPQFYTQKSLYPLLVFSEYSFSIISIANLSFSTFMDFRSFKVLFVILWPGTYLVSPTFVLMRHMLYWDGVLMSKSDTGQSICSFLDLIIIQSGNYGNYRTTFWDDLDILLQYSIQHNSSIYLVLFFYML